MQGILSKVDVISPFSDTVERCERFFAVCAVSGSMVGIEQRAQGLGSLKSIDPMLISLQLSSA